MLVNKGRGKHKEKIRTTKGNRENRGDGQGFSTG